MNKSELVRRESRYVMLMYLQGKKIPQEWKQSILRAHREKD